MSPKGEPLPDNLWTQFVAVQATLMQRLTEGLIALGVPQPFGWAVVCYTLGVRLVLFPLVKEQGGRQMGRTAEGGLFITETKGTKSLCVWGRKEQRGSTI